MGADMNRSKKKICIFYTGGTIGMERRRTGSGGYVLEPPTSGKDFLRSVKADEDVDRIADITFVPLMNKDSTNVVPEDWTKMALAVQRKMDDDFDGFVIAHGTDTMHFTASALAFAFGPSLKKPIVLTGAQATPDISHGDARVNLLRAVEVACKDLREVVVVFGDFVWRGCRVQKKDEKRFDAFETPAEFPLGYITEEIILSGFVRNSTSKIGDHDFGFAPSFANGLVQISLIPGLKPNLLFPVLESHDCEGVILQSFGAGNVPNEGVYSFNEFIRHAVRAEKPVVIASQFPANSTLASYYKPGLDAIEAGAIPTGNMTNAAATAKFRWAMALANDVEVEILDKKNKKIQKNAKVERVRELMHRNYVGEVTEAVPAN